MSASAESEASYTQNDGVHTPLVFVYTRPSELREQEQLQLPFAPLLPLVWVLWHSLPSEVFPSCSPLLKSNTGGSPFPEEQVDGPQGCALCIPSCCVLCFHLGLHVMAILGCQ